MLNLLTKIYHTNLINYKAKVSRKENTKTNSNILQDEDESYNWAHIKIDPVNTEFKT